MTARLIDGKAVAAALRARVAERVGLLPYRPGLTVVLVGDDAASGTYVRNKDKAAAQAGIDARTVHMPADTSQETLLRLIDELNRDGSVDGILVQLPLPPHIDANAVVEAIDPAKDVDGFHPINVGRLASGRPALVPCTPRGVMRLLADAAVTVDGAQAIVLGRSAIVGRPVAALLLAADATVTVAHSHTNDLAGVCRRADIVVARWVARKWFAATGSNLAPRSSMSGSTDHRAGAWLAMWRSRNARRSPARSLRCRAASAR